MFDGIRMSKYLKIRFCLMIQNSIFKHNLNNNHAGENIENNLNNHVLDFFLRIFNILQIQVLNPWVSVEQNPRSGKIMENMYLESVPRPRYLKLRI